MAFKFRAHHFLCALCFEGKGYSPPFIANFQSIMDQLNADSNTLIEVVPHTDSICAPCPNRTDLTCSSQEKITQLDNAHGNALDFKAGEKLSWHEAKEKIAARLTIDTFHQICASCSWKEYGICESKIINFLK